MASVAHHGNRQDFPFATLVEWIKTNPNKSKQLAPIEISKGVNFQLEIEDNILTLDSIGLPRFKCITTNGPLATIGWIKDAVYRDQQKPERLRELVTEWQKSTDNLSDGLIRKRRKIHDGIGSLANSGTCKDWLEVFGSIGIMNKIQFIFVKDTETEGQESEKLIAFSSNPTTWKSDEEIWVADYNGRWLGMPENDALIDIVEWLEDAPIRGWTVDWQPVKGTKEEIIEIFSHLPSWRPEMRKLLKDDLAQRLGRALAVRRISEIVRT